VQNADESPQNVRPTGVRSPLGGATRVEEGGSVIIGLGSGHREEKGRRLKRFDKKGEGDSLVKKCWAHGEQGYLIRGKTGGEVEISAKYEELKRKNSGP